MMAAEGRTRRLLMFNLAVDRNDPILSFALDWISALAGEFDRLDVVTMTVGDHDLPANVRVYSVGKEAGYGNVRRAWTFYRTVVRLVTTRRYDACFAHMMPLFLVMASPFLKMLRIRCALWYAHNTSTRMLRAAVRASDVVVATTKSAFPFDSSKLVATGQGIDTRLFHHVGPAADLAPRVEGESVLRVVAVGRIAPVKRLHLMIEAVVHFRENYGTDIELSLVGPILPHDRAYAIQLTALISRVGVTEHVRLTGGVPRSALPALYSEADLLINLTQSGFDKSVLEAMSCETLAASSNPSFKPLLTEFGLWISSSEVAEVTETFALVRGLNLGARRSIGAALRTRVEEEHSLDRLASLLAGHVLLPSGRVG